MLNIVFEEITKRNMLLNDKCIEDGVICVGYALDIGDISRDDLIYGRKKEFLQLELLKYNDGQLERIFKEQEKDAETLLKAIKTGKGIRVWRSNEPHNICAFAFLCDIIYEYNINVFCIELPLGYPSWSLLKSEMYSDMLLNEYWMLREEIKAYRNRWRMLREENAQLRAITNGVITSVPEDFYDSFIEKNISSTESSIGEVIVKSVQGNNLGVSLNWLFLRIKTMIENQKIKIVRTCDQDEFATIIKLDDKDKYSD